PRGCGGGCPSGFQRRGPVNASPVAAQWSIIVTPQDLTFPDVPAGRSQVVNEPATGLHEMGQRMIHDLEAFLADELSRPARLCGWSRVARVSRPVGMGGQVTGGASRHVGVEPC